MFDIKELKKEMLQAFHQFFISLQSGEWNNKSYNKLIQCLERIQFIAQEVSITKE